MTASTRSVCASASRYKKTDDANMERGSKGSHRMHAELLGMLYQKRILNMEDEWNH